MVKSGKKMIQSCSEKVVITFSPHKSGHGEQRMGTAHAAGDSIEMKRERFNKNKFFDCLRFFVIFIFSSRTYGCRPERAKKDSACERSNTSESALEGARRRRKAQGTL